MGIGSFMGCLAENPCLSTWGTDFDREYFCYDIWVFQMAAINNVKRISDR